MKMTAQTVETEYVKTQEHNFAYRVIGNGYPIILFQRFRGTMDDEVLLLRSVVKIQKSVYEKSKLTKFRKMFFL